MAERSGGRGFTRTRDCFVAAFTYLPELLAAKMDQGCPSANL
jgi:hypothetical protein